MSEKEIKPNVAQTPQTLKNQIHEARKSLTTPEILEMGDEGVCHVYETLFGLLRQWILSAGNKDEIAATNQVIEEFKATKREVVYCEVGIRNYEKLFKYTIDRNESTYQEAAVENHEEIKKSMINITWGNLKDKRMKQYQKLWDIFKDMTDADEDVGNKNLTANKLRGNYDVRDD